MNLLGHSRAYIIISYYFGMCSACIAGLYFALTGEKTKIASLLCCVSLVFIPNNLSYITAHHHSQSHQSQKQLQPKQHQHHH